MNVSKKEVITHDYTIELTQDEANIIFGALSYAEERWKDDASICYDLDVERELRIIQALKEELE